MSFGCKKKKNLCGIEKIQEEKKTHLIILLITGRTKAAQDHTNSRVISKQSPQTYCRQLMSVNNILTYSTGEPAQQKRLLIATTSPLLFLNSFSLTVHSRHKYVDSINWHADLCAIYCNWGNYSNIQMPNFFLRKKIYERNK